MSDSGFSEPILHADMDAFFVEVERLRRPELVGIPVVVGGAGRRGVVAAASYEARRFGIRSAMPMAQARAAYPQLTIVAPDHQRYAEISHRVFELFASLTPDVEGLSLDEAFLDISGLRRHFPSPAAVGEELRRRIRLEVGLPVSVGIAANKMLAKMASETAKPDGLFHLPRSESLAFLRPQPVRAVPGIGEATHAALEGLGVETVGDLADLEPDLLVKRFGAGAGRQLAALARGSDDRPFSPDRKTRSMSVSETYAYDLTSAEQTDTEILRLCDRLGSRLTNAGVQGTSLTLTVRYSDFETVSRQEVQPAPISTSHELFTAAKRLRAKFGWDRPIRLLGVGLAGLEEGGRPRQLLVDRDARWEELSSAVATVRGRYGESAVGPARLTRGSSQPAQKARSPDRD